MRKIREALRLKFEAGLTDREVASAVGASRSTVQECLRRVREAGLSAESGASRSPIPVQADQFLVPSGTPSGLF